MTMSFVWIGLAGGTAAFAHCLGMCGGFALHLSRTDSPGRTLGRQLVWHAGRIFTYGFLGALAGFGGGLLRSIQDMLWIQNALAYGAGAIMMVMGLVLFGVVPSFGAGRLAPNEEGLLAALFRHVFQQPTAAGALTLGVATGFLPCPIVLAFLAYAAQSGSVLGGVLIMGAMGLGTVWSLLLLGLSGHLLNVRLRRWGAYAGGVLLVLLGLATVLRGTAAFHRLLGCPAPPPGAACCGGGEH